MYFFQSLFLNPSENKVFGILKIAEFFSCKETQPGNQAPDRCGDQLNPHKFLCTEPREKASLIAFPRVLIPAKISLTFPAGVAFPFCPV